MSKKDIFTLEEIKKAFWKTFHKSGEVWFNCNGSEEDNEDSTNEEWLDLKDRLLKLKGDKNDSKRKKK